MFAVQPSFANEFMVTRKARGGHAAERVPVARR